MDMDDQDEVQFESVDKTERQKTSQKISEKEDIS
jgi:hypothetical protein